MAKIDLEHYIINKSFPSRQYLGLQKASWLIYKVVVKLVKLDFFFCGRQAPDLSEHFCKREYATRMHGPYFNNLSRVFHTKASGIHMLHICTSSFILYSLFIKYFKFIYNLKKNCIRAVYTQT